MRNLSPNFSSLQGAARYSLQEMVGEGSFGVVYRALDHTNGAIVALKTLRATDAERIYRLKQEFRTLVGFAHRNLAQLYELVVENDQCFYTMEFVDGASFVDHTRADGHVDLTRLAAAAQQLASGLRALHQGQRLHRDIKPSNVLVTHAGRTVILDFGLATVLQDDVTFNSRTSQSAGTLAYMAPEQALGTDVSPASDWYSVGVLLYEALGGRLPFDGPPGRLMMHKLNHAAPPLTDLAPHLPPGWAALVMQLLESDPQKRPGAETIVARLDELATSRFGQIEASRVVTATAAIAPVAETPFVGRDREWQQLNAAYVSACDQGLRILHVHGPSGIGKSELIRRFLASLKRSGTAVLAGRCHPQEVVPFKALDAVIDGLSRALSGLSETRLSALLPPQAGALVRLFPVLGRVAGMAQPLENDSAEPAEIRRRGFAALRELLKRLAAYRPTVLWIDDAQWADPDSAVLLRELIRPPNPPPLLLIMSYRSEDQRSALALSALDSDVCAADTISEIGLTPLDDDAARDLICQLRPEAAQSAASEAIAAEALGSPFLIRLLATQPDRASCAEPRSAAAVLQAQAGALSPAARAILEVVSVAGHPLDRQLALAAAGADPQDIGTLLRLENDHLLRSTVVHEQPGLEVYHDRIREILVAALGIDQVRMRHHQLAAVLRQSPDADALELFTHYLGAGLSGEAGQYAERAADRAANALAFDQAADLYEHAIRLRSGAFDVLSLRRRRAEALANAGRGHAAAVEFEAAARHVQNHPTASSDPSTLQRAAAEQYLRSGHVERGTELMREVLHTFELGIPSSAGEALRSSLRLRGRFLLTRRKRWSGANRTADVRARQRLAASWAAAVGYTVVDPALGDVMGLRCLVDALYAGDRTYIARSLGLEAIREACLGGRFFTQRSHRLLAGAEHIARDTGDPYDPAWIRFCAGAVAYFTGLWPQALSECEASSQMLRERCRGAMWEIVTTDSFAITALAHMGQIRALAERLPAAISYGDERGDLYGATSLRMGLPAMLLLAQDRPQHAREVADDAIARWPNANFLVQHYLHLLSTANAELYLGNGLAAWQRVEVAWPKLKAAHILTTVAVARGELRFLRGKAAIAAAIELRRASGSRNAPAQARALEAIATAEMKHLRRERLPAAAAYSATLQGLLAAAQQKSDDALLAFAHASTAFERAHMPLHRAAVQYVEGALRAGPGGAELQNAGASFMREQTIVAPDKMARSICPLLSFV